MTQIRIHPYVGHEIKPYLHQIGLLRMEVFAEFPYLYEGDLVYEESYLSKFSDIPEAIAVLAFDGDKVIGASTGMPLECESDEPKKPFLDNGLPVSEYFYFSESVLSKPYRGLGIGHQFFDLREAYVKKLKRFKYICFCSIIRPDNHPLKPKEYFVKDEFWKKRGYTKHPELLCHYTFLDIGEKKPSVKPLVVWIKKIA